MKRDEKQLVIQQTLKYLWPGNVDTAIKYITSIPERKIRNKDKLSEMVAYLERKKPFITCHASRRIMNYRISSNASEKSNDIAVAARQKHNGMSWSLSGSGALAVLKTFKMNNCLDFWIRNDDVALSLQTEGWDVSSIRVA